MHLLFRTSFDSSVGVTQLFPCWCVQWYNNISDIGDIGDYMAPSTYRYFAGGVQYPFGHGECNHFISTAPVALELRAHMHVHTSALHSMPVAHVRRGRVSYVRATSCLDRVRTWRTPIDGSLDAMQACPTPPLSMRWSAAFQRLSLLALG